MNMPQLDAAPPLPPATDQVLLYVGIDIAKSSAVAAFISNTLLEKHGRYEQCPTLTFAQNRMGFTQLAEQIRAFAGTSRCAVLLEATGHYHMALQQFLLEQGHSVYIMHVLSRPTHRDKTDKRDAIGLANQLFLQIEKGVQLGDRKREARRVRLPTEIATRLKGLMRHRYELVHEITQRRNKLTAICDELFPEFTMIFKDPNRGAALTMREKFPTPADVVEASFEQLRTVRIRTQPGDAQLRRLQELAKTTIGTKSADRQFSLCFEQKQLIAELKLLQSHLTLIETEINAQVESSREGQILLSMPAIGPTAAATIIAAIGSIANFESGAKLKKFFGWAPVSTQTGTSIDFDRQARDGSRVVKQAIYFAVLQAIRPNTDDNEWKVLYERLVPLKCSYDARLGRYLGKSVVIGRIAGQMTEMIYMLLKRDARLLEELTPGAPVPEPALYDREKHRVKRSPIPPLEQMAQTDAAPPGQVEISA